MSNFAKSSTLHLVNVIVNIRLVYFYRSGLYVTCQTWSRVTTCLVFNISD